MNKIKKFFKSVGKAICTFYGAVMGFAIIFGGSFIVLDIALWSYKWYRELLSALIGG